MARAVPLGEPFVPPGSEGDVEQEGREMDGEHLGGASTPSVGVPPFQSWWLSRILLGWVFPLVKRAAVEEKLAPEDLFLLEPCGKPDLLFDSFIVEWRRELGRRSVRRRWEGVTLIKVLMRLHLRSAALSWLGRFVETLTGFTFPIFLNLLIRFVKDMTVPNWKGIMLALLMLLANAITVVIHHNSTIGLVSMGFRIRASLVAAIFRKVVVLRQDAFSGFSTGRLNNMITTDVDSARQVVRRLHVLVFEAPLRLLICLVGLYRLVGVSVFIGMSWMGLVILANPVIMYLQSKLEEIQQAKTDERVFKVTETISAIQMIKCYAWEEPATKMIEAARRSEIRSIWRLYCMYIVTGAMWSSVLPITTVVMFTAYSRLNPDVPLTAETAFTAITLLDMLNNCIFDLPWVFNIIITGLVAAKRMERLFFLPEVILPSTRSIGNFCATDVDTVIGEGGERQAGDDSGLSSAAIDVTSASFSWPRASDQNREGESIPVEAAEGATTTTEFRLNDITLRIPNGALVSIVGATASGKTSLLHALLGEMPQVPQGTEEEGHQAHKFKPGKMGIEYNEEGVVEKVEKGAPADVMGIKLGAKIVKFASDGAVEQMYSKVALANAETGTSGYTVTFLVRHMSVRRHKAIAFAPQQPWIFNATVRDNILFGETFVEKHYADCVRCCGLKPDFEVLKSGDQTKVGEKGIALSGGQKARVGMARAAYKLHASNIFLLDDPYSALDAHVARQVHEEAVQKLLAKKTRLVVTNRLEFVKSCDMIIVLNKGSIEDSGQYEEVCSRSESLRKLLQAQGLDAGDDSPPLQPNFKRGISYKSVGSEDEANSNDSTSCGDDADNEGDRTVENEETYSSGNVKMELIAYYLKQMGTPVVLTMLVSTYVISEVLSLLSPWWISKWTEVAPVHDDVKHYLIVYACLSFAAVLFMGIRDMLTNILGFRAATRLHALMFASVLRAPMSWFQDIPQGRIINRFSKDIEEIDKEIVWTIIYCVVPIFSLVGMFAMVGSAAWQALLAFTPMFWLYYRTWKYYNKAALDVKRISKVVSSPVYDHFNNICRENGLSLIRAHHQVKRQCRENNNLIVEQQRPTYTQIYLECWFGMRMEHMGNVLVFFVAIFMVFGRGHLVSASTAGLALMFAGVCSDQIEGVMDQLSEFGIAFNCVERVREYSTSLPVEDPLTKDLQVPSDWPSAGKLEVQNLWLRYRPELPWVLKGLTFTVEPGKRLGIVGRTGAGKSSLLLALFRIAKPAPGSQIFLDQQDLLTIGLKDLRGKLAMIPQEPVLFQASLRYNIDPFDFCSAADVWGAIEEAQLAPWVLERSRMGSSLENDSAEGPAAVAEATASITDAATTPDLEQRLSLQIKEGGKNLSAGQRQMVAIARAVLRRSKFVVLDEATAALDSSTDAAIQLAIRECFSGATTLTIAHRLKTILNSDCVMVLAEGKIVELGHPDELRNKKEATHTFKGKMGIVCGEDGIVQVVNGNTPADTQGIKEGDKIVNVNTDPFSVTRLIGAETGGSDYTITVGEGVFSQMVDESEQP